MKQMMELFAESNPKEKTGFSLFVLPKPYAYYPSDECIKLGSVEVDWHFSEDITEEFLRKRAITTLMDKQQRIRAEAFQHEKELQKKIDVLLLLTHTTKGYDNDNIPF